MLRIKLDYTETLAWSKDTRIYSRIILLSQPESNYAVNINMPIIPTNARTLFGVLNVVPKFRASNSTFSENESMFSIYGENYTERTINGGIEN